MYANHPLCQLIEETYKQFFVFVCKSTSHTTLYDRLTSLEGAGGLEARQERHWNGRHGEIWSYRFANQLPLRSGEDAHLVNWLELTITHEKSGKRLYHNTWVTNHPVTAKNMAHLAKIGRTRWKVENENINILKTKGYNLNHNFGHGKSHLANVFFSLNVLAFLVHTTQHLLNAPYRLLRDTLAVRLIVEVDQWLPVFRRAFDSQASAKQLITFENISFAIAAYEASQIFVNTPWRAYVDGNSQAITADAKKGAVLFYQTKGQGGYGCALCHQGDFFTDEKFHVTVVP